ncbi:MAG: hypothetical protein D6729_07495 [Deltaproteobacteria bacterium]|nr:MAG: hypothetical protein D6729_07495 [Deltaproteobacteria bacterium]
MIRRGFALFALIFFLEVTEGGLRAALGLQDWALGLSFGVLVYLGARLGLEGAITAAAAGYVMDLFTGGPIGPSIFLCVATYLFVRLASGALDLQQPILVAAMALAARVVYALLTLVLVAIGPARYPAWLDLAGGAALALLPATLAAPAVYALARAVDRRAGGRESEAGEVWLT